jgi:Na+-transporting methylmalonyl-CoA/oxaloacetate decarboxylase gamma subunit
VLFSLIYPPIKLGFRETLPSFGISFVTSSLIVQFVTPNLIKLLSKKITTLTGAFLTILFLIVLIVIINRISKIMMAYLKKKQEEKKINRLETESEKEKKIREGIEGVKKGAEEVMITGNYREGYSAYKNKKLIGWFRKRKDAEDSTE